MSDNNFKFKILDLCNAAELDCRPYSGRAMYGKQCLGITHNQPERVICTLFSVALEMDWEREDWEREDLQSLAEALQESCTDSMGRSAIVYFPDIELTEDECKAMSEDDGE
jgi:hypothetical protein